MTSQDIQLPTELYDPEDPSIDDDIDQNAGVTGTCESVIRTTSKDVSVPIMMHKDGELESDSGAEASDLVLKSSESFSAKQHISGSVLLPQKEPKLDTKSSNLDMFSNDADVTSNEKLEIEEPSESPTIRSFDSRLNRLLDSGVLNIPLTLSPFIWKSKRSKTSHVPDVLLRDGFVTDEEAELAPKDQLRSSICVPPVVMSNQSSYHDEVFSKPKFLKPPEDDEEEDGQVFSPPVIIKSHSKDISPDRPRAIHLTRDTSPEEPVQDDVLDSTMDSTMKPPRVIRLDRVEKRTPSPVLQLDCDTPAEPLRIIRLNRDNSLKEKPRIIQLDRIYNSTSESAAQSDELESSTDDLRRLIGKSTCMSKRRKSPPDRYANRSKSHKEPEKLTGTRKSRDRDHEKIKGEKSQSNENKSEKIRSFDENKGVKLFSAEKKKDASSRRKDEKNNETSSKKSDNHRHDSQDRKRQLVVEKQPNKENHELSKRHKYDGRTPESDGKSRRNSSKKRRHSEENKTLESSHDRNQTKHKKHKQTNDDDTHKSSQRGARNRRSESRHSEPSRERNKSPHKHKKRSKSKDNTADVRNSSNRNKNDKAQRNIDSKPAASGRSLRHSSPSPHVKHTLSKHRSRSSEHVRGSRSRSRKHKSKTHRHKHSRSRSSKRKLSRSASGSCQRETKQITSAGKKKKSKQREIEDFEHNDGLAHRRHSRYSSPTVHRYGDRSTEEDEKSVSHVNQSSSHTYVQGESYSDQERKHSSKQSTGKELEPERTLSLLEVCMKTKYGQDFDPNVLLHCKHRTKSSDDDIEILGVTYGTDEELPESSKFQSPIKIPEHRKKGRSHKKKKRSNSYVVQKEPVSPEKTQEHYNDEFRTLTSLVETDLAEHQSERESDSKSIVDSGMAEESPAHNASFELIETELAPPMEHTGHHHKDTNLREAMVELRSVCDEQMGDIVADTVDCEFVNDKPCNDLEKNVVFCQSNVPSTVEHHIPGICEGSAAAGLQPLAAGLQPVDSTTEKLVATGENLRVISSPELENSSSESTADVDNEDQVPASVLAVSVERNTNLISLSSLETSCTETAALRAAPVENTASVGETHALNAAVSQAVVVTSATKLNSQIQNADTVVDNALSYTNVENSPFPVFVTSAVEHKDFVACDTLAKALPSNSGSSSLYSSNIMSSSGLETPHSVDGNAVSSPKMDVDVVPCVSTTGGSIALPLPDHGTALTLSERFSLHSNSHPLMPSVQLPSLAAPSTLPQSSQVVPVFGTVSSRFPLPSTPLPLLPRAQLSSSSLASSPSHLPSAQLLVPASAPQEAPTLPSIIQSLFVGKSGVLQDKTVEELQRLSLLFQKPITAVNSSAGARDSVSSPFVSASSVTTVVQTSVTSSSSGPTTASQLLASLLSLSKSSNSSTAVVPPVTVSRASAIDFNSDDVASPKSNDSVSFSPPSPVPAVVVPQQQQQRTSANSLIKRIEPEISKKSSSITTKIEKKPVNKSEYASKIAENFKPILKPYFSSGKINKEEYKEIMRKAVPQICQSRSGDTSKTRMARYAEAYVNKVLLMRKYLAKKNKAQPSGNKR